ncbi:MAG: hypothetical protein BM562_18440 [Alphaproteobacteria bacterium MedPE-SWcel]|nr:MAG: hypothetical protein BM562_18440 [Alphaproteobacteria bacterium MedPE-SWcel]
MSGWEAQITEFAKSVFRPGNTACDRCDVALKAVIDERCSEILGLEGSTADEATVQCRFLNGC